MHESTGTLVRYVVRCQIVCGSAYGPTLHVLAVENPVMHGYAQRAIEQRMSFSVQPWQFGHGEVKRTCFWTRGLNRHYCQRKWSKAVPIDCTVSPPGPDREPVSAVVPIPASRQQWRSSGAANLLFRTRAYASASARRL